MKNWIIVAVCLVLAGAALFAVAMSANGWDFTKLSTTKYIENVHEISEPFENIYIDTDTADVVLSETKTSKNTTVYFADFVLKNGKDEITLVFEL